MSADPTKPNASKDQAIVERLLLSRVEPAANSVHETPKQFFTRHATRLVFRQHHELQRALASFGFLVENVRRIEEHPVWRLSLRSGSAINGREPRIVRRRVSQALNELGYEYPSRQVEVQVCGDRVKVTFIWHVGRAGWLAFT